MVFTLENEQLMLQPTGQGKNAVFPEAKDRFFSKIVDATIEFSRDQSGRVTELTLNQGAFKGVAKRKD